MAGGAFSLAALGAALPVSTRGFAIASSSSTIYPSSSSSSLAVASARSSFNGALIGRGRVLWAFGTSSSELRASSHVIGFSSGTVLGAVSLRNLVWVGQKAKKKTGAGSSSSSPVFAAAAVATAVEEAAAAPTVTTEALPRPKKVGKGIVRLRLTRLGRKKRPFFRIVATHSSWRRDGKYIELLGHYNPLHAKDDLGIVVKADRIKYWLGVGAQPSDTVTGILHKVGILKKLEEEQ